jgi:glycosyltransferase involved in cell wall biosynthesis
MHRVSLSPCLPLSLSFFMMRRVLHITESRARSGAASQLLVLARGLAEQRFEVHVASLGSRGPMALELCAAGISTTELGRRAAADPLAFYKLLQLVRRIRPDVLHAWDASSAIYAHLAAKAGGARNIVVARHAIDSLRTHMSAQIDRRIAQRATKLVASSEQIRRVWAHETGVPAERIALVPPGVPTAPVSGVSREELLQELHLPPEARLIGVIGRLVPEKRVKDLIWAADLLRVLHDNLRLLIIGDGPLRTPLEQYARMASDLEHIQFLGERADVSRIMPHLEVLWNAAENRRQSVAMLEAMAAGVPVIASDTPLNRELVFDGETGYLVNQQERSGRADRARHTDRIFTDRDLAARLGANGARHVADRFDAQRMVKAYADLYRGCAS